MLAQISIILVITISLAIGGFIIMFLSKLRWEYKSDFLNSFLYYHILLFAFGVYGILGNVLVRELLLKFELGFAGIETIAHFLPFIGIPVLVAAWYLFLKMMMELIGLKIPQGIAISFFLFCTAGFLVYGLIIRNLYQNTYTDLDSLNQRIKIVFYTFEALIFTSICLYIAFRSMVFKKIYYRIFVLQFVGIMFLLTVLKSISLHFSDRFLISGLYYLVFYFGGNLPIAILVKRYLNKHQAFGDRLIRSATYRNLFEKFGITKREREIIEEICKGKTNKQIAEDLFITLQTVKDHTHNIFKKTEVKNRVQLVQLFSEHG